MTMLKEKQVEVAEKTFLLKELPLGKSQEVFMHLLSKVKGLQPNGEGQEDINWASVVSLLNNDDLNFLRERLFNENCLMLNENEKWVPLTKHVLEANLRLGQMMNLLAQALAHTYADFLQDLDIESLAAQLVGLVGEVEEVG